MSNTSHKAGTDAVEAAFKSLEKAGFSVNWEIVPAAEDVLQLDYDDPTEHASAPPRFWPIFEILRQRFQGKTVWYSAHLSKSGKHSHVLVYLPEQLSIHERVAWQAAFGSDPKREALHLLNISNNVTNPILLFMQKGRVEERRTAPLPAEPVGRKFRDEE